MNATKEKALRQSRENRELMRRIRAHFLLIGTSYTQWARERRIHPSTASYAILVAATGRKTRAVREALLQELKSASTEKLESSK